ncbi:hypothetical protein [Bradyrhizobium stylosanthis]|uniref:hypothetical protein n=1 Tax=Bradyrhizobium stylosanthis TaxID=1803665 RepID=UPI0007C5434C|nr:hypothetical protein [Bradyrhizobium stylosanthis]
MNVVVNAAALVAAPSIAVADLSEDTRLLDIEARIWGLYELAHQHDDEMTRLHCHCVDQLKALSESRPDMDSKQRWDFITQTAESKEHERLVKLTDPYHDQIEALVKEMWPIKARTADGRRAKFEVLVACCMSLDWQDTDKDADWDTMMARHLLLEFMGGKEADELRKRFIA